MISADAIPMGLAVPFGFYRHASPGVGVAGGGSHASMYSVNQRFNFVMRLVSAKSHAVSVAFVVENVPTAWRSDVVAVAKFVSAWAWVCSI